MKLEYPWNHRIRIVKEKFWLWFVWLLPKELIKWAAVRMFAHATQGRYGDQIVPDLRAMDALQRWGT